MKIRELLLLEIEPPLDPKPVRGRPIDPRGAGNSRDTAKRSAGYNRETRRAIDRVDSSVTTPQFVDTVGPNGEPKEIPLK